jgi:hypothetical protein
MVQTPYPRSSKSKQQTGMLYFTRRYPMDLLLSKAKSLKARRLLPRETSSAETFLYRYCCVVGSVSCTTRAQGEDLLRGPKRQPHSAGNSVEHEYSLRR